MKIKRLLTMGIFRWLWKNMSGANPFVDDTEDEESEE